MVFLFLKKKNIDKQLLKLPINMIIVFKKMLKNQTSYINENINNFIIYSLNQINISAFEMLNNWSDFINKSTSIFVVDL